MILEVPEKTYQNVKLRTTGRTLGDRFGDTFGDHFYRKLTKTWLAPSRWYQGGQWAPDRAFQNWCVWRARHVRRFALPCPAGYCLVINSLLDVKSGSVTQKESFRTASWKRFSNKTLVWENRSLCLKDCCGGSISFWQNHPKCSSEWDRKSVV